MPYYKLIDPANVHKLATVHSIFKRRARITDENTSRTRAVPSVQSDSDEFNALAYQLLPHTPNDPATLTSYIAFAETLCAQFEMLDDAGFYMLPTLKPYENSSIMLENIRMDGFSYVQTTATTGGIRADNFMANPAENFTDRAPFGWLLNDVFRWVHDMLGHGISAGSFGPKGEYLAWRSHRETFPAAALPALWCETRGQASWTNAYADHASLPLKDRPFAEQKNGNPPFELV